MKRLTMAAVCAVAGCCASFAHASGDVRNGAQALAGRNAVSVREADPQLGELFAVNDWTVQTIVAPADAPLGMTLDVTLDGVAQRVVLWKRSMRASDFRVLVQDENGLSEYPAPEVRTYRGILRGVLNSSVTGAVSSTGELTATIIDGAGEVWHIQPLSEKVAGANPTEHIVYRAFDVAPVDGTCGNTETAEDSDTPPFVERGTGLEITDIAIDSDFEFYQDNGSNVANSVFDIERVMDAVEFIYERDTSITYEITVIVIRATSSDPYSSSDSGTLLNQFANYWNNNSEVTNVRRDVAHLFTGRSINGSVIGIAQLSVICNQNSAYGLSWSTFTSNFNQRTALTAHELGHNWSAGHCSGGSCKIMCSVINGCGGIGLPNFGATSISSITSFRNSRSCLSALAPALSMPFFDDFNTGSVNTSNWVYNDGGAISTAAVGEPSPPNSLNLDSSGSNAYGQDNEIRTNVILLAGTANVRLSYYTEHRGVENGEELIVYYRNNNNTWVEINRITSDGVDQNSFDFWEHVLPANALHNEFRVRFIADGSDSTDDWYVDDVLVNTGPAPPPTLETNVVEVTVDPNAIDADPRLTNARTFDLQVTLRDGDDWTASGADASISGGRFYQTAAFEGDPNVDPVPAKTLWPTVPQLEFDSFYSRKNFGEPSFAGPLTQDPNFLSASWFDLVNGGVATYTVARYTVEYGDTLQIDGESGSVLNFTTLIPFSFTIEVNTLPPTPECKGDLNNDNMIDLSDLAGFLAAFGSTILDSNYELQADFDDNGTVDLSDLAGFLAVFGTTCP
ncbi:MAG: hypothetical protein KDA32_00550 [Phycisphaerales bacterium]|nr:hypothetical protein [Phycisphaerales bacterium]